MMYYLAIQGKQKLDGTVSISGAKNAALPLLALTLLSKRMITISNMPEVA
ncbi:MAG: UDP-N-acetylglucosamine 1-carboxyvinyltransferase, partial [Epsilonproteobacteria bacterium]|nr:UDP-N-acetylglucosamine 1-carboxyvinyltransferase [Campylobacterota bacterium]